MPRVKLTKKVIERLGAPTKTGRPILYWDEGRDAVRGFGVLCSGVSSSRSYVLQRDLPGGRTRRVTLGGVNELTLEKAREKAADIAQEMRHGLDPKAKRETLTLRSALDAYLKTYAQRLRPRSVASYRAGVERHLSDWLDRPLVEITREMVEKRHTKIAENIEGQSRSVAAEWAKKHEARARAVQKRWREAAERHRALAAAARARKPARGHAAANGVMRTLRLLWSFAQERNPTIGPSPVRLRKQWFKVARRERLVRADDLPKFYASLMRLNNHVQRDFLSLLLFTGLRRREASSLIWEDVDLRGAIIRVRAAATKADRKLDLPMSDLVRDLLVSRRALGDGKFVFPANSASGHLEEPKFALDEIADACGVRVSPHDLRRTFITVAESADISPLALKALVNHSLGSDVTSGYIIMPVERLREAAQKVADQLKQLCRVPQPAAGNVAKLPAR